MCVSRRTKCFARQPSGSSLSLAIPCLCPLSHWPLSWWACWGQWPGVEGFLMVMPTKVYILCWERIKDNSGSLQLESYLRSFSHHFSQLWWYCTHESNFWDLKMVTTKLDGATNSSSSRCELEELSSHHPHTPTKCIGVLYFVTRRTTTTNQPFIGLESKCPATNFSKNTHIGSKII